MQIRPVDVNDDSEFHAFHQILEASRRFERPLATVWSEPEAAVTLRRPDPSERWEAFGAFEGQTMVGAGVAEFPLLDNTAMVFFDVDVPPELRRHGIGTSLVGYVVDRANAEGRTVLIAMSHYPLDAGEDHPYRRFAASCGFDLANSEMHRVLELPVPVERIQGWVDECAPHHEDYRIETYVDDLPDVLLPSYVTLLNQLVLDAPTGDIDFEEEALTVEVFHTRQAKLKEQGRTLYVTVATVDDGTQAVAHSVIAVPREGADEPNLYQWATLVGRGHRGHRLGLATKARNLLMVQRAHPGRTMMHTSNSDANGPMVAINERMGFRPVEVNAEFQRKL